MERLERLLGALVIWVIVMAIVVYTNGGLPHPFNFFVWPNWTLLPAAIFATFCAFLYWTHDDQRMPWNRDY